MWCDSSLVQEIKESSSRLINTLRSKFNSNYRHRKVKSNKSLFLLLPFVMLNYFSYVAPSFFASAIPNLHFPLKCLQTRNEQKTRNFRMLKKRERNERRVWRTMQTRRIKNSTSENMDNKKNIKRRSFYHKRNGCEHKNRYMRNEHCLHPRELFPFFSPFSASFVCNRRESSHGKHLGKCSRHASFLSPFKENNFSQLQHKPKLLLDIKWKRNIYPQKSALVFRMKCFPNKNPRFRWLVDWVQLQFLWLRLAQKKQLRNISLARFSPHHRLLPITLRMEMFARRRQAGSGWTC